MKLNIILSIVLLASLVACGKKADDSPAPAASEAPAATTAPVNEWSTAKAAAAVFRASSSIDKLCWAPDHTDRHYGHFLVHKNADWYEMIDYEFHADDANNTFYLKEIADQDLAKVFPDVTGMDCISR